MKVILTKDVVKIGNKYDVKEFSDGYAQNVLISKGLAIRATPVELAKLEERKKAQQKRKQDEDKQFNDVIAKVKENNIVLKIKSNEKGHLFRSVQKDEIVKIIKDLTSYDISLENITFKNVIKEVGHHTVLIKKGDVSGEFSIIVE